MYRARARSTGHAATRAGNRGCTASSRIDNAICRLALTRLCAARSSGRATVERRRRSREQYIHTLRAATTALLRRASCNESETSLFPSIRATAPGLLPADCECIATFRRGDELTKRSIRLQAMEILLIEVVDVEAVAATVCVLGWDCPFFHARHCAAEADDDEQPRVHDGRLRGSRDRFWRRCEGHEGLRLRRARRSQEVSACFVQRAREGGDMDVVAACIVEATCWVCRPYPRVVISRRCNTRPRQTASGSWQRQHRSRRRTQADGRPKKKGGMYHSCAYN